MAKIEQKIKEFVRAQGVKIVGVAGPDRMDGPPSLDPAYIMSGAKSIVSFAMPMDVPAIYEFLGKKSPVPHNVDQTRMNQKAHRIAAAAAGYIKSLGFRAKAVPSNNDYRRSPDAFATHPSFSHRFGAIAAGIAGQGWSGNVMTKEYGAAVYLGTVVTDALLESDPGMAPRYFIDNYCKRCKICEKTCVAGMFDADDEEYVLLNNELHPRAKRFDIDLCNMSCFGLHSLSRDKKWTTWGHRWVQDWVDHPPDKTNHFKMRYTLMKQGTLTGDSTPRYDLIRRIGALLHPEAVIEDYVNSHPERMRERERFSKSFLPFAEKIGVKGLRDERILTCGQCALVCGPTVEESSNRFHALIESGLVVPGPESEMVNVPTYEHAVEMRRKYLPRVSGKDKLKDALASTILWHKYYFGINPKSIIRGIIYDLKLKKAVRGKVSQEN